MADFFTRTGWMCRKKLVRAVRAATLSVLGMPWRKIDPQTWPRKALIGLPSVGRALTAASSSVAPSPDRSDAHGHAVVLPRLGVQAPLRHRGVTRLPVHGQRAAVDHEVVVRGDRDVHPVHRARGRAVEIGG